MSAKKNYSDKLKDPRWQKKRLEIFDRDGFTCRMCGSKEKTLNVHHVKYVYGKDPWEYDNDQLKTYCEDCHQDEHDLRKMAEECICSHFKRFDISPVTVLALIHWIETDTNSFKEATEPWRLILDDYIRRKQGKK